jgi:hypothetical protein
MEAKIERLNFIKKPKVKEQGRKHEEEEEEM